MDLQISFKELITDIPKINSSNLFCSIYLQEQSNYIFQANITLNTIHCLKDLIILSKNKEKLQFRFQTNKIFLGSISIPIEDILNKSNKDFSQWLTIFEDIYDDLFDGQLTENDEDIPKALMGFCFKKTLEREKSPPSILKNFTANNNSVTKFDEKRGRGVSFAKDVLKKTGILENETSIQKINFINEEELGEKPQKKQEKTFNLMNSDDLLKIMNEKCCEVVKKKDDDKNKKKISTPIKDQKIFVENMISDSKKEKLEKIKKSDIRKKNEQNQEIFEEKKKTECLDKSEISEKKNKKHSKLRKSLIVEDQNTVGEKILTEKGKNEALENNNSKNEIPENFVQLLNSSIKFPVIELGKDQKRILELEKEISYWKLEFHEKNKSMDNLKESITKLQGFEIKYNGLLEMYEKSLQENNQNYELLLEKKYQLENDIIKLKSQTEKLKKMSKKNDLEIYSSLKEKESELIENLKQKNFKLASDLKKELDEKNKILSKFNEVIAKYQEIAEECKQIQENSQKREEKQSENIKHLNDSLKVNRQKIIEFENSNEFLLKENENLKIEKKKINKNLISSNEHNKHLCKELMEEKVKNIEELKNLTDLLNDKKLEINKLQNELEILRRTHEIANLKVMKFEEFDFVNELKKKNSELEEFREEYQETPKKISEKGDILNKTEYLIDQSEIQDKNQRIQDLEIMLQGYQKNENFGKLYMPLFKTLKNENIELKDLLVHKEESLVKSNKKQFELSEEIAILHNKLSSHLIMIQNLTSEIKKAQDPIAFVKKYFPNPNNNYSAEKNDEIDVNLKLYLLENKLPIKITKISSGTYFYGSLKIEIYLENCCLMVKFNNEKIFLDDFNKTYLMKELSAMFYQNNNDKKMENNIKQDVPEIIISEWSQEKITIKKDQNKFSPPGKTISHSGKLGEKLKETSRGDALLSTTDNSHKKKNEARK